MFDRASQTVHLFQRGDRRKKVTANVIDVKDPEIEDVIGHELYAKLLEDVEMLDSLIPPPDIDRIQARLYISMNYYPRNSTVTDLFCHFLYLCYIFSMV